MDPVHVTQHSVVYYPPFSTQEDLNNHYHRACWYLPYTPGVLDDVIFGTSNDISMARRPDHMCASRQPVPHIRLVSAGNAYAEALSRAKLVLVWTRVPDSALEIFRNAKIPVVNVTTDDVDTAEYGNYCRLMWTLHSADQRNAELHKGRRRFREFGKQVSEKNYKSACVFGTGPSIDTAFNFDFSSCFTHVCNSTVQSQELLGHINPDLVSAGDVVSHFGVSSYAERFRNDLFSYMRSSEAYFLTTAPFGILLALQYPKLRDQIILCNQGPALPNFALDQEWWLPGLDSVLNIMMLPVAATFHDTIYLLGCDGKNPDPELNEDFWAHSKFAQYHDLVDTGHLCHPTFEIHRQVRTWARFQSSVKATSEIGESRFGKRYVSLAPSFTPGVTERYRPDEAPPV